MAKKATKKVEKVVEDVTALPIPKLGKELGRFEGETFYIAEHENGVLYHVYNSMDLIIRPNITSGYETLVDLVRNQELYNKLTGEEKESFELTFQQYLTCYLCLHSYFQVVNSLLILRQ